MFLNFFLTLHFNDYKLIEDNCINEKLVNFIWSLETYYTQYKYNCVITNFFLLERSSSVRFQTRADLDIKNAVHRDIRYL